MERTEGGVRPVVRKHRIKNLALSCVSWSREKSSRDSRAGCFFVPLETNQDRACANLLTDGTGTRTDGTRSGRTTPALTGKGRIRRSANPSWLGSK